MKTKRAFTLTLGTFFCIGALYGVGGEASSAPPRFYGAPVQIGELWNVTLLPNTTNWVTLEFSEDLMAWSEVASIATVEDAAVHVDTRDEARLGFYRIRSPGRTASEARLLWQEQGMEDYSFKFQEVKLGSTTSYVRTARVQVKEGTKTVTEVMEDGEPAGDFDPVEFPTIEEMFDWIEEAQESGVRIVWVRYHLERGYAARVVIDDRGAGGTDEVSQFWVSELAEAE